MEGMLRHVLTIRQSRSGRYRQTNVLLLLKVTQMIVYGVSFSADGRYVVSAGGKYDKTVKIWEVQTNTCVATLEGHTSEVMGVSFSADGRYVASCSDKTVKIWEVQTNKCVATLRRSHKIVKSVSFSADGRYVVSCSDDRTVKIWEVQTNKCVATLEGHTDSSQGCEFFC